MNIGHDLWRLTKQLAHCYVTGDEILLPPWPFSGYFMIPPEFFSDEAPNLSPPDLDAETLTEIGPMIRELFQPSPDAFAVLMAYEDFWLLEPPILAVHASSTLPRQYYKRAFNASRVGSVAVFGDGEFFGDYHFRGESWAVPHLMSFCDHHVISESPDSWWGAFLADEHEVIYPRSEGLFPDAWRPIEP